MKCQKHRFQLEPDVHYLNCAYMSPLSRAVAAAGKAAVMQKARPYNIKPIDFFLDVDRLKSLFAQLINAEGRQRIAIIPSVSYGMATVAKNLKTSPGQNIVIVGEQFPSNVYVWRELAKEQNLNLQTVAYPADLNTGRGKAWNERILNSINTDTVLVALEHVHWANGTLFDLINIGKRCREVGAIFVIDGTQSVGALPFDIQAIGADALICAGYKTLMGPYGLGYAYFGEYFDNGKPIEETWMARKDSDNFANLVNYQDEYTNGAARHDMGEKSSFIHVPMAKVALLEILERGIENIQQYSKKLTSDAIQTWASAGCWIEEETYRSHHLFGVQLPKGHTSERLQQQLQALRLSLSIRGEFVRISTNVYNNAKDIAAASQLFSQL